MSETQNQQILSHLKDGQSITQLEALNLFGCLRLGGRIYELRAAGHPIETKWESDGDKKRWARYRMVRG